MVLHDPLDFYPYIKCRSCMIHLDFIDLTPSVRSSIIYLDFTSCQLPVRFSITKCLVLYNPLGLFTCQCLIGHLIIKYSILYDPLELFYLLNIWSILTYLTSCSINFHQNLYSSWSTWPKVNYTNNLPLEHSHLRSTQV